MKIPVLMILTAVLFSCGLPQTTLLDPPTVVNMGLNVPKLAFNPVPGVERYVVMYKFYWPGESVIDSDRNTFFGNSLSPGDITPRSLGFVQMKKTAGTGGSYPVDSGEITLTQVTAQVVLDFDLTTNPGTGTVEVTGAAASETVLYRRVLEKKRDGSLPVNSSVTAKNFFNRDYDFLGVDPYEYIADGNYIENSIGQSSDGTGLDGDVFRLFNHPPAGSYSDSREVGHDLIVAVVVYSNSYDISNGGAIDSIPVYLGTVEIRNDDWKS